MEENMLLEVCDLSVQISQKGKTRSILNKISFSVREREILGIVGESGSGKSMTALAVMGLLPESACLSEGAIKFEGSNILELSEKERRSLNGRKMGMIFQEPMTCLNPVLTVGAQIEEMLWIHTKLSKEECYLQTIQMMEEAELTNPEQLYAKYPHQLSGGMRQRIMIAIAMILKPKLLIADEPTTALDVTVQQQILRLLKKLNQEYHVSILFISHDLGVIKSVCDRTLVFCNGRIVEENTAKELFLHPKTDYTKTLLLAVPKRVKKDNFKEREDKPVLLSVKNLNVYYKEYSGIFFRQKGRRRILNQVSLQLHEGETLGIVGESGSGKSTLAKAIAGLIPDMEGEIYRKERQPKMVFQDPYSSLNPSKKVEWILEEPLKIHGGFTKEKRKSRIREMINKVGLEEKHLDRYLSQLSGGQRQRVSIACALMLKPKLVILDEPVSALDVTVQAQILKLLSDLRKEYQLSYLFISHDLNVVYQMCDRVAVLYQGEIVEQETGTELYEHPKHSYTKKLLEAIPKW